MSQAMLLGKVLSLAPVDPKPALPSTSQMSLCEKLMAQESIMESQSI